MKTCPYCAEDIQDAAIVCKHCRSDLAQTSRKRSQKKTSPAALGCLSVILLTVLGIAFCSSQMPTAPTAPPSSTPSASTPSALIDLDAKVHFDGTVFTITNQSKDVWSDVRCTLNKSGLLGGGYEFVQGSVAPGERLRIRASQFTKSDGTRFNPITTKPTSMSISARVKDRHGFFYGGWN